ncbi:MAG: hypothetical protein M3421_11520 [Bacteroidota bacterium]|nr:hypothetical protein [Bacteroidota bacterium]
MIIYKDAVGVRATSSHQQGGMGWFERIRNQYQATCRRGDCQLTSTVAGREDFQDYKDRKKNQANLPLQKRKNRGPFKHRLCRMQAIQGV